jgi:uncharacterized protein (TIGR02001 family)
MPRARLARLVTFIAPLLGAAALARADVGGSVSLQTDARERGMSYSAEKPSAQLSLAWDGDGGWYAGAQLAHARFVQQRGARLQAYGGRVVELAPGLDGEAGVIAQAFENVSRYDFQEVYVGLLGERWSLRLYHSPNYYGSGQRSVYGEFNLRWPVITGVGLMGHVGVLRGYGAATATAYTDARGPTRVDLRLGGSWQLGESSELQLAWVATSRGGPYTWSDSARRRSVLLGVTATF